MVADDLRSGAERVAGKLGVLGEAPAVIVDADTHEVVIGEADNGFQDYRDERALVR